MIKKIIPSLLVVAALLGGASQAHAQQLKVGTVDMKRVFENYYKTKDAEQRINESRNQAKKELEDRMETYKKASDELNKLNDDIQRPELSSSAKDARTKQRDEKINELKNMEREIREFQGSREKQLSEQTMRMRTGIVDEISKVIKDRVQSDQYDLVLDLSGQSLNAVNLVLFSKPSFEFTNDVITALNKNKGSEPAPTPELTPASGTPKATSSGATPKKRP